MGWFHTPRKAPAAAAKKDLALDDPGFLELVRRRAYAIWEYEGRPIGQSRRHWAMAIAALDPGTADAGSPQAQIARLQFRSELAEVQLLLDFISGRSDQAFDLCTDFAANARKGKDSDEDTKITQDELTEIATLRFPPVKSFEENAADAVLLARVRDKLNRAISPASGLTVAFTLLTWHHPIMQKMARWFTGDGDDWARRDLAQQAYPQMGWGLIQFRAASFALFVAGIVVTFLTLGLSVEIADGQSLVKTFQTVEVATQTQTNAPSPPPRLTAGSADPRLIQAQTDLNSWWDNYLNSPIVRYECTVRHLLGDNGKTLGSICDAAAVVPIAAAAGVYPVEYDSITNTLADVSGFELPMLYAIIGAIVSALRCIYQKISTSTLAPWDVRLIMTRIFLGIMAAACIGLFFAPSGTVLPGSNIGNLSLSGLAFLAGYAVNDVFLMLDKLIRRVFATDDTAASSTNK